MVIFQFFISIAMISSTLIALEQMSYIRSKDPGYDKEQIMVVPLNPDVRTGYEVLRNELLSSPGVLNTSTSSLVPTRGSMHLSFRFENRDEQITQVIYLIDREFADTYGLRLVAGENSTRDLVKDTDGEFLVSERTVQEAGYESPMEAVGKGMEFESRKGFITGVVKDMNIYSLHRQPYAITYVISPIRLHNYLSIRLHSVNVSETLDFIQATWNRLVPSYPLDYFFLDENFEKMHRSDKKLSEVFTSFSLLAIVVACLGLFGLAAFSAEQRTKEIGIRKVLGAPVSKIYLLLSKEFIKWVIAANLIAWPVSYFFMKKWLQNFVYRVSIGPEIFLLAALFSLTIAILTVSFQSAKAAFSNPVKALKHE